MNLDDGGRVCEQRHEARFTWKEFGGSAYLGFMLRARCANSKFIETNALTSGITWSF